MEVTTPFILNDLPDNAWSVCWPGYEYNLVNNPAKAQKLLEILFDLIKVDEVQLSVRREGWSEDKYEIMHINISAWFQDSGGLCRHVNDFIVSGIKFAHRNQAEQFKEHMDKRLMWARLGGGKFQ